MGSASDLYSAAGNHLLAALPAADFSRMSGQLERVPLKLGDALYESGSQLSHVYFPVSGIVSLIHTLADGGAAEIAVVGRDGCVGIAILLGARTTQSRAVVQVGGFGYRMKAQTALDEFQRCGAIQLLLLRYIQALMTQMMQTAVCNRHHPIEQQLCRWLLLSLDLVDSLEVHMTQELISNMLGVRRSGITQAASKLQRAGLIGYRRGRITVFDRAKLEVHACECYRVVKNEMDRLLGDGGAPAVVPHRQHGFAAL